MAKLAGRGVGRRSRALLFAGALSVAAGATSVELRTQSSVSAAEPGEIADVMFLIDGSGSISSADWALQLEGYAAALGDAKAFPSDGSVRVGVLQWTTNSELEIPLTSISSEADRNALQSQIRSLVQNGGGTTPAVGILSGTEAFVSDGRPDADWVHCLSSDGQGGSLTAAVADAVAMGVDRLAVLAVEDPGFFSAADAKSYYGNAVFGGGTVTVARNAAEFAALVNASCRGHEVTVEAIEVTQGVQDWKGSVPLVSGRPTYVRVFASDDAPGFVTGQLEGVTSNGSPLPGSPLSPINDGGRFEAPEDAVASRGEFASSLNFRLPKAWTESGPITLNTVFPGGQVCSDEVAPVDSCAAEVSFGGGLDLDVKFVTFDVLSRGRPSSGDATEQYFRAFSALPIPEIEFSIVETGKRFLTAPSADQVLRELTSMQRQDGCNPWLGCSTVYVGLINSPMGKASGIPGTAAVVGLSNWGKFDYGYEYERTAHELAHTRSLFHSVNSAAPQNTQGAKSGWCGEVAPEGTPDFPYAGVGYQGTQGALLGPLSEGASSEVWGLDWHLLNSDPAAAVINPRSVFELMSYCAPALGVGRWPSKATWEGLINAPPPFDPGPFSALPVADRILLSGSLAGSDGVKLDPAFVVPDASEIAVPDSGEYEAVLYDDAGAVLSSVPFDAMESHADRVDGVSGESGLVFVTELPLPAGGDASRVEVLDDAGQTILSRTASANAPTVSILQPFDGASLGAGPYSLEWAAEDGDADALAATVAYSSDGGATWETIATNVTETSVTIPQGALERSAQGAFRVLVSDGLRTTQAVVTDLIIPNNPPSVTITSPRPGQDFVGVQPVRFEALAADVDAADVVTIEWFSSLDGALGSGTLELQASDLTEGAHTITVTATDSQGANVSATTQIAIERVAPVNAAPTISLSSNSITAEGNAAGGWTGDLLSLGGVSANDPDGDEVVLTSDAPGVLPVGTTEVTWVADDGEDRTEVVQLFEIVDTTPPVVEELADLIVQTDAPDGTLVRYTPPSASDLVDQSPSVLCLPPSESVFAVGQTRVDCVASDFSGNEVATHFVVDVLLVPSEPVLECADVSGTVDQLEAAGYNVIQGTDRSDFIVGTNGDDFIVAGGGADSIYALRGNDVVCAGNGNDNIRAGDGIDIIDGGPGRDKIYGQRGADTVYGGAGSDSLWGGGGADTLYGNEGRDFLSGNGGRDTCDGGLGKDSAHRNCEVKIDIP